MVVIVLKVVAMNLVVMIGLMEFTGSEGGIGTKGHIGADGMIIVVRVLDLMTVLMMRVAVASDLLVAMIFTRGLAFPHLFPTVMAKSSTERILCGKPDGADAAGEIRWLVRVSGAVRPSCMSKLKETRWAATPAEWQRRPPGSCTGVKRASTGAAQLRERPGRGGC